MLSDFEYTGYTAIHFPDFMEGPFPVCSTTGLVPVNEMSSYLCCGIHLFPCHHDKPC
jgi:hypothetical protein